MNEDHIEGRVCLCTETFRVSQTDGYIKWERNNTTKSLDDDGHQLLLFIIYSRAGVTMYVDSIPPTTVKMEAADIELIIKVYCN